MEWHQANDKQEQVKNQIDTEKQSQISSDNDNSFAELQGHCPLHVIPLMENVLHAMMVDWCVTKQSGRSK